MFQPDVIVVGGGLIGLGCATAIAREGMQVLLLSSSEPGAASGVAAGILAPAVGEAPAPVRALGFAARDLYPEYLTTLASRTGRHVPLDRSGVIEIALHDPEVVGLQSRLQGASTWIDASTLGRMEPSLAPAVGAAFHPLDGAVDAAALLDALRVDAEQDRRILVSDGVVTQVHVDRARPAADLESGARVEAAIIVLAAGAWAASIRGLPRRLPVVPVRGQIVAFDNPGPRHVVMGPRGYVVRRGNQSLVGSTMEYVGFDAKPTEDGAAEIGKIAMELSPSYGASAVVAHRAGLRPITPDFLPMVGRDPDCDGLLYACGHSKNGVLLAPLTGQVIADLVARGASAIDATPWAPGRFENRVR